MIPQFEPWFGDEERSSLINYIQTDGWYTEFIKTNEFEKAICNFINSNYCIAVNNGTVSLTLAAYALGVEPGDEVIVPNYTMIATPNSIKILGAKPVFVDVEPSTLCIDFDKVEEKITSRTKGIILVLANGRYPSYGIERILEFAKKHNLFLIEDAAQSLGSKYPCGTHQGLKGDAGSLSFSVPKIISTGQGGAIVTNSEILEKKLRKLKDFGRVTGGIDVHDEIGFNFKFTELQAVLGLTQLKKINYRIKRKVEIYERYRSNLKDINGIVFFDYDKVNTTPWFVDSIVDDRSYLIEHLSKNGIGTRKMYPPINRQKAYNTDGIFPVSEMIGDKGLWLPSSSQLSDQQIDYISEKISSFYQ